MTTTRTLTLSSLLTLALAMAACSGPAQAPVKSGPPATDKAGAPAARPATTSTATPAPPSPVDVTVYIMSKCPYAVKTLDALLPVMDRLGARARLRLDYIVTEQQGKFTALHGEDEVVGNKQQLCAMEIGGDAAVWRRFISCQNQRWRQIPAGWKPCAAEAKLDPAALEACFTGPRGEELLRASMARSMAQGAKGSPTILLGGKEYRGGRSAGRFMRGICGQAPTPQPAPCASLPEPVAVQMVTLSDRRCKKCNLEGLVSNLRGRFFPRLEVTQLDYSDPEGRRLYKELKLERLPAVLFKAGVERAEDYPKIQRWLQLRGTYRKLKVPAHFDPTAEICDNDVDDTGNGKIDCADATCQPKLICRKEQPRRLDIFVMSQCPYGVRALDAMKEVLGHFGKKIKFHVHYIVDEPRPGEFKALHGQPEVAENIRQLCAHKLYGKRNRYLDYIWCRNGDYRSDRWRPCAKGRISAARIERCVKRKGDKLLSTSGALARALEISGSPTWLVNNRHKFHALSAEKIRENLCKHNPGLAGCDAKLSTSTSGSGGGDAASCGGGGKKQAPARRRPQPTASGAADYSVGVPACDEYVRKFLTCVRTRMPDSTRPLLEQSLRVTAAKWRAAAATPDGKKDLEAGCKAALKAARTAMAEYGCKW